MQVYPESSGHGPEAFASATAGYGVGRPEAVMYTAHPPPPSYAPPAYEPPANAYGFNPSSATAPAQYGAPLSYGSASTSYGYPLGPVAPQTQHQNGQNVQVNFVNAPTSPPVIVAQPAPVVVSPPSYLGWSIFNFLCCFWPLGLAAIIYSVKVGSARNHGEAKSYSLTARNLNIAATTIAPIVVIVVVIVSVVGMSGSAASNSLYSPSYYAKSYYYSYGYYYYYSYLTYYTYYNTFSYLASSSFYSYYYLSNVYYSYTAYRYESLTASQYASDFYYTYAQGVYYYG